MGRQKTTGDSTRVRGGANFSHFAPKVAKIKHLCWQTLLIGSPLRQPASHEIAFVTSRQTFGARSRRPDYHLYRLQALPATQTVLPAGLPPQFTMKTGPKSGHFKIMF